MMLMVHKRHFSIMQTENLRLVMLVSRALVRMNIHVVCNFTITIELVFSLNDAGYCVTHFDFFQPSLRRKTSAI